MSALERIKIDEIREFVKESWRSYSSEGKSTEAAEKAAEVVYDILNERGLVNEHSNQTFVDVLIAAALLHDLFKTEDEDSFIWVFEARSTLSILADKYGVPKQIQDAIFDAIEAQLGEKMPVQKCRPQPGTPQEMFAYAVWFVKKYLV